MHALRLELNTSKLTRPVPAFCAKTGIVAARDGRCVLDSLVKLGDDGVAEPPAAADARAYIVSTKS